ncbi:hypothetical protein ES703_124803 [subsurface metagenome]
MTSPDILKATELVVKTLEDLDIPYYTGRGSDCGS